MFRLLILPLLLSLVPAPKSPQPGRVVYVRVEGKRRLLHVMNADGTKDRLLPGQTDQVNVFPAWSPDGKRIVYQGGPWSPSEFFVICVINADGTGRRELPLPKVEGAEYSYAVVPAWSPDGTKLTFHAGGSQGDHVFVADVDGMNARKLNPVGTRGIHAFWFPDGKRVGYTQRKGGNWQLVACNLDGTGEEVLVTLESGHPTGDLDCVSSDGTRLLYVAQADMQLHLRNLTDKSDSVVPLNEPDPARFKIKFSAHPAWFRMAAWSPDGQSFLMALPTPKATGIFRVTPDGRQKIRLTPDGVDCLMARWTAR